MSTESNISPTSANKITMFHFLSFWIGQLFSVFGSSVVFFSVLWYFTDITKEFPNQGTIFTSVSALVTIPWTIVLFFSGVFIDRWNRKKIILVSDAVQAFMTIVLVVLFMFGFDFWPVNLWIVTAIFMIRQTAQGFHQPSIQAIIPLMIPKDKISRFNGLNTFVSSTIQIAGPIFSGFLIGLGLSFTQILWIDVITFCIALIPTIFIKIPPHKIESLENSKEKSSYFQEFKEGFRTIMDIRGMPALFLVIIVLNFITQPFNALQPIYFQQIIGSEFYTPLAINGIFFQVAVFIGAGLMMLRKKWKKKSLLIIGTQFLGIGAWYLVSLAGFGFPIYFIYIASSMVGLYASIYNTTYQTIFHETIPADKLGRVFSVDYAISFFLGPIATLISGPLSDWLGLENLYLGIAIFATIFLTVVVIFSDYRYVGVDTPEPLSDKKLERKQMLETPESL